MKKSRCEGCVMGRKDTSVEAGLEKVPMNQPRVFQTESSENHLPTPVPMKRRGIGDGELVLLSERIVIIRTIPGDPKLSRGCGDVVRIQQSGRGD